MSQFDLILIKQLFDNAENEADYKAAKKKCRQLTSSQTFELVDAMIDARLRLEHLRIAREGL